MTEVEPRPARNADFINRLLNDPSIKPAVRGRERGELDLSAAVPSERVVALEGRHGAMLFHHRQPGLFEMHTMVLPEGRGDWTIAFVRGCLRWMFARTEAIELFSRVPRGNLAALALVRNFHLVYEFSNPRGWFVDDSPVPAAIYTIHVDAWVRSADGLQERGRWFHDKLKSELARFGKSEAAHPDDEVHDRYVGAACEMAMAGQPLKAVAFYNRFAAMADYRPIRIVDLSPLTVDVGTGWLIFRDGDFFMASCMI